MYLLSQVLYHEIYSSRNRRSVDNSSARVGDTDTVELVESEEIDVDLANSILEEEIGSSLSTSYDGILDNIMSSSSEGEESLLVETKPSSSIAQTSTASKYTTYPSESYDPDFELLTVNNLLDGLKNNNFLGGGAYTGNNDSSSLQKVKPIDYGGSSDTDQFSQFNPMVTASPFGHPDQLSMTVDSYVHDAVAALCLEDVDFDVEEETTETDTLSYIPTTIIPETTTVSPLSKTPPTADQNETADKRESPKTHQVNLVMKKDHSATSASKSVPTVPTSATSSTQKQKRRSVSSFSDTLSPVLQLKRRVESSIAEVMRSGEKLFSNPNRPTVVDTATLSTTGTGTTTTSTSCLKQKFNNRDSWGIGRISLSASKKNALVQNMRRIDEETKRSSKSKQSSTTSLNSYDESGSGHNSKPRVKNSATAFFESALRSATRSVDAESLKERTFKLSGRNSTNSASTFDLFDGREIRDGKNNSFFFESTSSYGSWKTPLKQQILGDLPTLKLCDSIDIGSSDLLELPGNQAGASHAFDGQERRRSTDTVSSTSTSLKQQQATSRRLSAPKGSSNKSSPPASGSTRQVSSSLSTPRTPAYISAPKSRSSLQSKSALKYSADVPLVVNRPLTPHAGPISSTSSSPKDAAASIQLSLTVSKSPALIRTKKFNFSDPADVSSSETTVEEVEKSSAAPSSSQFISESSDYTDQALIPELFVESTSNPPTPKISDDDDTTIARTCCSSDRSPTVSASKPLISNARQSLSNTSIMRSKSSSNLLVSRTGSSPISPSTEFPMKTPIKTTLSSEDQNGRFSSTRSSYKSLSKLSSRSGEVGFLGSSRCARVPVTGPPKKKEPVRATSSLRLSSSSSSSSSSLFRTSGIVPALKDGDAITVSKAAQSVSKHTSSTRSDPTVDRQDSKPTAATSLVRKASESRMSYGTTACSPSIPSNGTQNRSDSIVSTTTKHGGRRSSFNTPKKDSPLCEFYPNVETYVTPFSMSAIGLPEESPALGSATTGVASISPCKNLFDRRVSSSYSLPTHSSPDSTGTTLNSTTTTTTGTINSHSKMVPTPYKESTATSHIDKSIMDFINDLNITAQSLSSPTMEEDNEIMTSSVHVADAGTVGKVENSGERIAHQQVTSLDNFSIANDETSSQTHSLPSSITALTADSNLTHTPRAPQPLQQSAAETPKSVHIQSLKYSTTGPLTAPKMSASSPFKSPRCMMMSAEKRSRDLKVIAISCDNILSSITKIKL